MEREGQERDAARRQAAPTSRAAGWRGGCPLAVHGHEADGSVDFSATGGAMFRLVAMCCVIAAFTFEAPRPAAAAAGDTTTYDTVDAIEVQADQIKVTGIISGQGDPTTRLYKIVSSPTAVSGAEPTDVAASRCDRLALLA